MAQLLAFSSADQHVLIAIFRQIEIGKVDTERLRQELALSSKDAARMNGKGGAKKCQVPSSDVDDEDLDAQGVKEGNGKGWVEEVLHTLRRWLPARQERVQLFKEDDSGEDGLAVKEEKFEESGYENAGFEKINGLAHGSGDET
ncbi:hypothetical protein B0O99DRAFT_597006 [Bisporella sp. PMI_857]|nr:hypothetical protein B0O99DRAFT_597006 [Bisporella sp. PMI_857]